MIHVGVDMLSVVWFYLTNSFVFGKPLEEYWTHYSIYVEELKLSSIKLLFGFSFKNFLISNYFFSYSNPGHIM